MNRYSAPIVLVVVTALFAAYGRFDWSWVAGPLAALAIWALDRTAHVPGEPAAAHTRRLEPTPVD